MDEFISANIVDVPETAPPVRQAFSETSKVSSRASSPFFSDLKTSSMVISLASDAGGMRSSSFFANRTVPVSASIR